MSGKEKRELNAQEMDGVVGGIKSAGTTKPAGWKREGVCPWSHGSHCSASAGSHESVDLSCSVCGCSFRVFQNGEDVLCAGAATMQWNPSGELSIG